jgi:quercetin dioxygenase-like cupin family protein
MKVIEFSREHAQPIRLFESVAAASVHLGDGSGEAHVYCLYLEPGGKIGEHQAGFGQLFLVVEGEAWAANDGQRISLRAGQGAYFARGEMQSKGSDEGATVIMVQVSELVSKAPTVDV